MLSWTFSRALIFDVAICFHKGTLLWLLRTHSDMVISLKSNNIGTTYSFAMEHTGIVAKFKLN